MKIGAQCLFLASAALPIVLSAQTTSQKPSPTAATARKTTPAKPKAAAPSRPPNIYLKTATSDGVVTGHTTDPNHMLRIAVSKEGGEVRTEPVWPDPSGDFTVPVLLLKPGWIVQAWVVDGPRDLAHSASMLVLPVAAASEPSQPVAKPAPAPKQSPASSSSDSGTDATQEPGAGERQVAASAQPPQPAPEPGAANPCEGPGSGDQQIVVENDRIRAGSLEIKGAIPDGPGKLSVCVAYTPLDIALGPGPAGDQTNYGQTIDTRSNQFDVLLKTAAREGQGIRLVWVREKDQTRITKDLTVESPSFSRVILPSVPKEGETLIRVDTAKPPAANDQAASPVSLSVFVNQDRVPLLDSKGSEAGAIPVDASGETGLTLKNPLEGGDCVVVLEFSGPALPEQLDFNQLTCDAKNRVTKAVAPTRYYSHSYPLLSNSIYNWGRVRGYMAAGGLFSFENNSFSQESIFLGLNMTKNWIWGGPFQYYDNDSKALVKGYKRTMLETFFEARLTSLPVAACTAGSSASPSAATTTTGTNNASSFRPKDTAPSPQDSGDCPNTVDTFLSTRKAALLNAGVSIPFILSTWNYSHRPYALSLGPLAKVGFVTPVGDVSSGTNLATDQQFYTNFGFGARFGLYRMSYSPNVSPDLESYIDVVTGRFSNFDTGPTVDSERYARPWRIGIEGVLKIPTTPFILGFGANIHQNFGLFGSKTVDHTRDSLQFLFGARFDAGKLFARVGSLK